MKLAILDDYQQLALKSADWERLRKRGLEISIFHEAFASSDDAAAKLAPFDILVLNNMDRYQLALDAIRRIPRLQHLVVEATARYEATIARHKAYVSEHGEDMPEVRDWRWTAWHVA